MLDAETRSTHRVKKLFRNKSTTTQRRIAANRKKLFFPDFFFCHPIYSLSTMLYVSSAHCADRLEFMIGLLFHLIIHCVSPIYNNNNSPLFKMCNLFLDSLLASDESTFWKFIFNFCCGNKIQKKTSREEEQSR